MESTPAAQESLESVADLKSALASARSQLVQAVTERDAALSAAQEAVSALPILLAELASARDAQSGATGPIAERERQLRQEALQRLTAEATKLWEDLRHVMAQRDTLEVVADDARTGLDAVLEKARKRIAAAEAASRARSAAAEEELRSLREQVARLREELQRKSVRPGFAEPI